MDQASSLSHAERGRIGARKRWGPPRVIRLSELTPDQRRAIVAYLEVSRAAPAPDDAPKAA